MVWHLVLIVAMKVNIRTCIVLCTAFYSLMYHSLIAGPTYVCNTAAPRSIVRSATDQTSDPFKILGTTQHGAPA